MANTWRIGEFGLTAFGDHNHSFNQLIQHFNDDINSNYVDIPILGDATYNDRSTASSDIYTNVPRNVYTFSNVEIISDANYSDVPLIGNPVYEDKIKNT
tara:strand:- start:461 stop:757 length:297 start_codon:yes stop_codon:yes gene_type:complete